MIKSIQDKLNNASGSEKEQILEEILSRLEKNKNITMKDYSTANYIVFNMIRSNSVENDFIIYERFNYMNNKFIESVHKASLNYIDAYVPLLKPEQIKHYKAIFNTLNKCHSCQARYPEPCISGRCSLNGRRYNSILYNILEKANKNRILMQARYGYYSLIQLENQGKLPEYFSKIIAKTSIFKEYANKFFANINNNGKKDQEWYNNA